MTTYTISDCVRRVRDNIADACARSNRDPSEITLVAVSKTKPAQDILAAMDAGLRHFGENRVEEAQQKIPVVTANAANQPVWHMIGHVQSRKVRDVLSLFSIVHSVDSVRLAEKFSRLAQDQGVILDILLEVNISGEESKHGWNAHNWQADALVREQLWADIAQVMALPSLRVRGLMTMAPYEAVPETTRPVFAGLAALKAELNQLLGISMPELSMGMTNDYPVAIEEGATIIRVGRAIFGSRT